MAVNQGWLRFAIVFQVAISRLVEDAREAITRFVFVPGNSMQADYTVMLGLSLCERPVGVACDLYRCGFAGKLIFTGACNQRIGGAEAEAMTALALAAGIPPDEVFCESRAAHARENLEFSWSIMKDRNVAVRAVNLIGISYHVNRALLTARSVLPREIVIGHVSYPSLHFDRGVASACALRRLGGLPCHLWTP